ncbi:hypothetical protein BDA96_04G008300 [Sorghum bicolor]|uniref:Uncharacterized protein n=2 Tax=Sorghum bicolor TaxID=4558 RepID=A0A921QZQ8_SORBI|nr:hypothetical protein BDA96_04G008300 [Sorghum bicolor]OQU84188.1 hypothetical protein SORBI_3004G007550 [Sorghum bicolor]
MVHISDIKLIRTDTTLDLSQKAEKGPLLGLPQRSPSLARSPPAGVPRPPFRRGGWPAAISRRQPLAVEPEHGHV